MKKVGMLKVAEPKKTAEIKYLTQIKVTRKTTRIQLLIWCKLFFNDFDFFHKFVP